MRKLELWIGRVEVLTAPIDSGDTRAFTNVVTWASHADDFRQVVSGVFEGYGWSLLGVEDCRPASQWTRVGEELLEAIERAPENLNYCIYTTFHYYPSLPQ